MDEETKDAIHNLELQLVALKTAFDSHALYTQKALEKAEMSMISRLEGMNEFREQLKDQNATFITRAEYDVNHKLHEVKIEAIQKIVWTGIGMLLIVQIAIQVAMHYMP